jgi:DNA-directed RNA polymerase sigma subunit (sigma70/sigma32)
MLDLVQEGTIGLIRERVRQLEVDAIERLQANPDAARVRDAS